MDTGDLCFVFYNITWNNGKLLGSNRKDHEKALKKDLKYAFDNLTADGIFLSECGEVGEGLDEEHWMDSLVRILPDRYTKIIQQSH